MRSLMELALAMAFLAAVVAAPAGAARGLLAAVEVRRAAAPAMSASGVMEIEYPAGDCAAGGLTAPGQAADWSVTVCADRVPQSDPPARQLWPGGPWVSARLWRANGAVSGWTQTSVACAVPGNRRAVIAAVGQSGALVRATSLVVRWHPSQANQRLIRVSWRGQVVWQGSLRSGGVAALQPPVWAGHGVLQLDFARRHPRGQVRLWLELRDIYAGSRTPAYCEA